MGFRGLFSFGMVKTMSVMERAPSQVRKNVLIVNIWPQNVLLITILVTPHEMVVNPPSIGCIWKIFIYFQHFLRILWYTTFWRGVTKKLISRTFCGQMLTMSTFLRTWEGALSIGAGVFAISELKKIIRVVSIYFYHIWHMWPPT